MSQTTARRVFAAGLLLIILFAAHPAEAAGPGGDFSGLLDRAWRWLASVWSDTPAAASAPRGIGLVYDADGGHIDPNGTGTPTSGSNPTAQPGGGLDPKPGG